MHRGRSNRSPFRTTLGFTLPGLVCGLACSLSLDLSEQKPCEQDQDCDYANGPGQCVDNFCQPVGGDVGGTETSMGGSQGESMGSDEGDATGDGTDGETGSDDGSDTTGVQCSVNSDCTMDQRCHSDGTCVNLISSQCQVLRWPDNRDNVVFLGSIIPTSGAFEVILQPLENAVQLAFDDFNDETSLQGDRKIAWLGCDSSAGADAAVAAAEHLIEVAEVPGIVGPIFSEEVKRVANEVAVEAGVMLITPTATAPSVTEELEDDDFVWRTIAPDYYQASAAVDLLEEREPEPEHILVLFKDDAYGNEMVDRMSADLDALPGISTLIKYPNPTDYDSVEQQLSAYATVLAGVLAPYSSEPVTSDPFYDQILVIGTSEAQILIYGFLTQWNGLLLDLGGEMPERPPMPTFTVTHGAVPQMQTMVNQFGLQGTSTEPLEDEKETFFNSLKGVSPLILDTANFNTFNLRYKIAFNDQEAVTASGLAYDASLVLALAACTVGPDEQPTGTMLRDAMPRLQSGSAVNFGGSGLSFISQARNALVTADGSVDLRGVSGALDWDSNGDIRTNCVEWDLGTNVDLPAVTPNQHYCLNPPPDVDGAWQETACP